MTITMSVPKGSTPMTEVRAERCESGCDPAIAPVVIHDSDGIPLCIGCWNSMMFDAHRKEVIRFRSKIRQLEVALRRCVNKHKKDPR